MAAVQNRQETKQTVKRRLDFSSVDDQDVSVPTSKKQKPGEQPSIHTVLFNPFEHEGKVVGPRFGVNSDDGITYEPMRMVLSRELLQRRWLEVYAKDVQVVLNECPDVLIDATAIPLREEDQGALVQLVRGYCFGGLGGLGGDGLSRIVAEYLRVFFLTVEDVDMAVWRMLYAWHHFNASLTIEDYPMCQATCMHVSPVQQNKLVLFMSLDSFT